MSLWRILGIFRCPYINECGPNKTEFDYEFEEDAANETCLTREHFSCPIYISKKQGHPINESSQTENCQHIHRES